MIVDAPADAAQNAARDEALLARIAQGDADALAALYENTKSGVYGFALSILRNPASAEDVMQETYIKIFGAAGSYRPQGKPMAWILTIVRNLALMKIRAQRGGGEVPLDELPVSGGPGFEQNSLDRLILRTAMNRLSDEERQIVVLHSVSGLKHREIAAMLEMPLSTVLSKYNRSLKKLQAYLREEGVR